MTVTPVAEPTTSRLRSARLATAAVFAVNGIVSGAWLQHIPGIKSRLELTDGTLGIALLAVGGGALIAFLVAGALIGRFGSRAVASAAGIGMCLSLPLPLVAPDLASLIAALLVFGGTMGAMDVAMNAQAVSVEVRYRRPIMSSVHALFSFGAFAGAATAGAALEAGTPPLLHVAIVTVAMVAVMVLASAPMLPKQADRRSRGPGFVIPRGPLLATGALALMAFLIEGAIGDWSALYLRDVTGAGPGLAAAGFAAFSLTMAVSRLFGDRIVGALGPVRAVALGAGISAVGLAAGLVAGNPISAVIGFGCVGLGMANVIPVLFSTAGREPSVGPATGIAAAATMGYLGLLVGPPVIGFIADVIGLAGALGLLVVLAVLIGANAGQVRRAG